MSSMARLFALVSTIAFAGSAACAREAAVPSPAGPAAAAPVARTPGAAPRTIPLTTSSAEARAAFERGERLMYEGKLAQSRPHFEAAIAADPALAQAYVGLAGSWDGEERKRHIARARELAIDLPEVERLWIEAMWSGTVGDPSATATAARVAALAPDDWRAHQHVAAIALYHTGDLPAARAAYERATQVASDRAPPYRGLALVLVALGDLARAEAAIERYVALSPREPRAQDIRGEILLKGGKLDEAERAFREAIAIDATYHAEDGISAVHLYRGDAASAAAVLRSGLTKRSAALVGTNEDQLARLHIGRALVWTHVAAGQLDRAEAAIREVGAAIADTGTAHRELRGEELRIELLAERGRWSEALRRIDRAAARARADGGSRMRLVRALGLLQLRVALGAGKARAIERASAALLAERADDPAAKMARALMAHHRRDARAVLAAAEELRGDDEAHAEANLLAAELLAAGGDRDEATRLWREVAGTFGRSPRLVIHRRRAERALASVK